jgi:uncharacterized phiE125 gp8 family phage protein
MEFHRITRVTAPTDTIVTLEQAKAHLRVAHDDEDDLITLLIEAATAFIEGPHGLGIALMPQQWRLSLDGFPPCIRIPLNPVQTIDGITYRDTTGATVTLPPASYAVDLDGVATVERAIGASWPSTASLKGSAKVTFTAGFETVPADLKAAALLIVGHLHENREAVAGTTGTATPLEVPMGVEAIFSRYRVLSFG